MDDQAPKPANPPALQAEENSAGDLGAFQSLQACIFNAPISIFQLGESGNILEVNHQACESLGFSHDELMKMSVFDIDPTMTPGRWVEHRKELYLQGSCKLEGIHIRKDGTTFPVEVLVNGYQFNGVWHAYSFIRDVSETKQAERALREGGFFLRKAQDVGNVGTYYFMIGTGTWLCSEKLDQVFGIDETYPHTLEGWIGLVHPDDQAEVRLHLLDDVMTRHNRFDKEYRIIRQSDQTVRWVHGLGELETDPDGKLQRMIGTIQDISRRKQGEEALQRSEERLRLALEASSDAIWDWDFEKNELYFSPRHYSMLGYEPDEFPSNLEQWRSMLHPEDRAAAQQILLQLADQGGVFSTEFRLKKKDGSWCWILGRGKAVQTDKNGKIIRLAGSNSDITERKGTEIALQQNEAQLRLLTDNMDDVIIQIDGEENILFMSSSAERAFGYPIREFIGQQMVHWIHPEDVPDIMQAISEASQTRKTAALLEYRHRHANGRYVWREATIRVLYDPLGNPGGAVICSRDISKRKRAAFLLSGLNAAAIQQAESAGEIFSTAAEQLKNLGLYCSIYRVDENRSAILPVYFTYHSRSVEILENLSGFHANTLVIPYKKIDAFRRPIEEKKAFYIENIEQAARQFLPKRLSKIAALVSPVLGVSRTINAPLIVDNEVVGLLTVQSDDLLESDVPSILAFAHLMAAAWRKADLYEQARQEIVARKEAESQVRQLNEELEERVKTRTAQLQSANKELEAFAYSVSHDLRAPLRAINGYTSILKEEYQPILDEEGKRVCEVISGEATRMGMLIDDLLEFSRLGRAEMLTVPVDMNALVKSVFQDLTAAEELSRVKFHKARLANTRADPNLLRQVWTNLLSNALKFSRHSQVARIEVGSSREDGKIVYWVRDNGAGFDMRYMDKLFGVFQRLHSFSEFEGTGVGLAIVRRIIQRHGGEVWASGHVGQGATFSFWLPLKGKRA